MLSASRRVLIITAALIVGCAGALLAAGPAASGSTASGSTAGRSATGAAALATSASPAGELRQLSGAAGCIGARSAQRHGCAVGRALRKPGPFMGSRAIEVTPDGRHVIVAAAGSNAVVVLRRSQRTGTLRQPAGKTGCVALNGSAGCGTATATKGANSVAVSPDGRFVYATARGSDALSAFRRNERTGRLRQIGCVTGGSAADCTAGIGLNAPDVVVVSPDGRNVYVGSFFGNAVVSFARDRRTGALTQLSGTAGCIAEATTGCATGIALKAIEGLAISRDGRSVYAGAALSNAIVVLSRNPQTGVLTQAGDGTGCVSNAPLTGCATGRELAGANAVTVTDDGRAVLATSLLSNSVTSFLRLTKPAGALSQLDSINGCSVDRGGAGCRYARQLAAPEGLAVSRSGRSVYAAAFGSGALAVFDRNPATRQLLQKAGRAACVGRPAACRNGRAMNGVSSVALSPDERFVYTTAAGSDAVNVFERQRP